MLAIAVPAFGATAAVFSAGIAHAAVASSIQVRGNQRIEVGTIKSYLTIKPHKHYTGADIDASVKALYATGLFSDVGIVQRGSVLVVTVVENPVINSVTFEGNTKVQSNVLSQIVELRARGVLTDAKLKADVFHIKQYYRTKGRSEAEVEGRVTKLPDNRVNVVFAIKEGERTGVGTIRFIGNKAFSSYRLAGIISTKTTNWLSWLTQNDIYNEARLNADADLLRTFYLKHGYADFQVLSQNAKFDAATGKYTVTFTVDEGPKYKFGTVNVDSSIHGVDVSKLSRFLRTKSGQTFDSTAIEKTTEDLTVELSRLGYVFAEVRPRGDRDYSTNTINLTYVIDEGPRVYIERIDIRGNTRTRDYVIRREFDISEGDAYNRVLINKAERKLRDLGFFKHVTITTQPGSAPDKVIVVVDVQDKSTGSFGIAGGVETTAGNTGLVAEVSMDEKNFLGRGQQVHIAVGGGLDQQSITASFHDPYFLGNHMSFGLNGYRTYTSASSARPFKTVATGGGVRIGLPITDALTFDFGYKIANIDSSGYTGTGGSSCSTNPTACFFPSGSRLSSMAGWGVTYSTIDSRLDPHEGVYFRFMQDFAGIGGNARFIRTTADARLYTPVLEGSDMVGLLKVTGGNIIGIGQPVSTIDNFFKGGETIRGFAPLGYGPRYYDPSGGTNIALGGKNYINGTAELQFPFPGLPQDWGIRGALFADAGILWGADVPSSCTGACNPAKVKDDMAIRSSVGASILWASPFGPIRADFAEALNKQSYDTTQFFRIGTSAAF